MTSKMKFLLSILVALCIVSVAFAKPWYPYSSNPGGSLFTSIYSRNIFGTIMPLGGWGGSNA